MTPLQDRLDDLRLTWVRRDASLVADFEAGLAEVAAFNDPMCIGPLLELFEDSSPFEELLFSVVHTIEAYADHVYVPELLRATEALLRRSPRWARILYTRVLNAPATRAELASAIWREPGPIRVAVRTVLDDIVRKRPEFVDKVDDIRSRL